MPAQYVDVVVFLVLAGTFPLITLAFGYLLRPKNPAPLKRGIYECGEIPVGEARIRFDIRYYVFALLFVVFDVEAVFIYPWGVLFRELGWYGFVVMMLFIEVLVVGLIYAYRKGALRWA